MDSTRRGFLRNMLLTATIVAAPSIAIHGAPAAPSYPHIVEALRLFDIFLAKMDGINRMKFDNEPLHTAMDDLYTHIFKNFRYEDTPEMIDQVNVLLRKEHSYCITEFRKVPPTITEMVWPVALMKIILRDYAAPINFRKLKTFSEFHDRYGKAILG